MARRNVEPTREFAVSIAAGVRVDRDRGFESDAGLFPELFRARFVLCFPNPNTVRPDYSDCLLIHITKD